MSLPVLRALEYRAKKSQKEKRLGLLKETFHVVTGSSARMRACLDVVALASRSEANVLISGETGTGKELFAWAIHNNSARAKNQFVVVDCASLPPSLVESTLFGYEKGAFTGADRPHKGLIKRADGGTLFLDEVGELPLSIQKSFLRVLQERKFRPLGGEQEVLSDFRLIAATNRNLDQMAEHRQFRKDLLFRLRAFGIELPLLRERPEDIPEISEQHMKRLCRIYKTTEKGFSSDFFITLARYDWPGNVRELVNALERAISAAREEPILFPKHLPTYIRVQVARSKAIQCFCEKDKAG
jgi:two-component system NtrC family response regulator